MKISIEGLRVEKLNMGFYISFYVSFLNIINILLLLLFLDFLFYLNYINQICFQGLF